MVAASIESLNELGFYGLAGHSGSPRDLLAEIADAERIGLGSVFLSERFNAKDAAVLSGAAGAASTTLGIATAATNTNTRHLMVTATIATTMHRLTGGRFALGLGRGIGIFADIYNMPPVTSASLADSIQLMRRLWHGETIFGHEGPAGSFPVLSQDSTFDEDIPVLLVAIGPKSLERSGAVADAVVLHTFLTDDAVARSVAAIRRGAEQAGRDPASVRVWSVLATVGDHLGEEAYLRKCVGRLATYCQGYGDLLVRANQWDPADLEALRRDPVFASARGALDALATVDELRALAPAIPAEWLAASAVGSAEHCAGRILDQFTAGADSVILHGVTPAEVEPVVAAYRGVRPEGVRDQPANPGWMHAP